jgi:hypothetical protein
LLDGKFFLLKSGKLSFLSLGSGNRHVTWVADVFYFLLIIFATIKFNGLYFNVGLMIFGKDF